MKKLVLIPLAIAASLWLLAQGLKEYARRGREVLGHVLEVENFQAPPATWRFKPLPDAEVMAVWFGGGPGDTATLHSGGHCMGYAFTRTVADGSFHLPAWKAPWGVAVVDGVAYAYAAGFIELTSFNVNAPGLSFAAGQHLMRRAAPGEIPDQREGKYPPLDSCPRVPSQ